LRNRLLHDQQPDGIGASVLVTVAVTTQRDYLRSGSSYLSQSM